METKDIQTVLDVAAALDCVDVPADDTASGAERVANKEKNTRFLLLLARELGLIDGPANSDKNRIKDTYFLLGLACGLDLIGSDDPECKTEKNALFLLSLARELGEIDNPSKIRWACKTIETEHNLIICLDRMYEHYDLARLAVNSINDVDIIGYITHPYPNFNYIYE